MNYFLFNDMIYKSDGVKVTRIEKGPHSGYLFDQIKEAHICVADIDVLIASASESALDKKDGILAKKFSESYQGDYVLQDEKIDNNIFQVIGIRSEIVKEVYSLIPNEKVMTFVPYAVAVRNFIYHQRISINKPIVFLDDLGNEKLITVFEGLKFSRTRTIFNNKADEVLSEVKRSAINFERKLADQKDKDSEGYVIVTNNKDLGDKIQEIEKNLMIESLDTLWPAFDGLKIGGFDLKYILPEEIIKRRRREELKKRTKSLSISGLILAFGVFSYFFNQINLDLAKKYLEEEQTRKSQLETNLNNLDPFVYHDVLKQQKRINYALVYSNISNLLPNSYEIYSFGFYHRDDNWTIDEYLYTPDEELYDDIPPVGALKKAQIEDFLVNNRLGKYLRIEL